MSSETTTPGQTSSGSDGSARLMGKPLPFDLGELVWLAGTQSYLIIPPTTPDYNNPAWRDIWYAAQQPVQIVGIKLSGEKIWYEFPGGGNDDGSRMYRTRDEAVRRASSQNDQAHGTAGGGNQPQTH